MTIQSFAPVQTNASVIETRPQSKKTVVEAAQIPPAPFVPQDEVHVSVKKDIAGKQVLFGTLGGMVPGSALALSMKGYFSLMAKMAMAEGDGPIKGGESGGIAGGIAGSVSGAVTGMFTKSVGQSLVAGAIVGGVASTATTALMGKLNGLDLVLNVSCGMFSGAIAGLTSYETGARALKPAH